MQQALGDVLDQLVVQVADDLVGRLPISLPRSPRGIASSLPTLHPTLLPNTLLNQCLLLRLLALQTGQSDLADVILDNL